MKSIRYYGPRDCRLEEIPIPSFGPDEVLIRVRACGICATDLEIYEGTMFFLTSGQARTPFTPGHEWSGEVVDFGANVSGFEVGDTVCGECSVGCRQCKYCQKGRYNLCPNRTETGILNRDGGFAEYIAFPHHYLHKCNELTFEQAACVEPVGVAVYAVKQSNVSSEDTVVVIGVGPIGLYVVQVAKAYGARRVIAVDLLDDRLQLAKSLGADAAFNASSTGLTEALDSFTGGEMVDVVFECAGKAAAWAPIPSLLGPGGRIGVVGLTGGEQISLDFDPLVVKDVSIQGTVGSPNCWPEAVDLLTRQLVKPTITHRIANLEFEKGIHIITDSSENDVKVMVSP